MKTATIQAAVIQETTEGKMSAEANTIRTTAIVLLIRTTDSRNVGPLALGRLELFEIGDSDK